MSVTITMSDLLRRATGQQEPMQVSAGSSIECLEWAATQFPVLQKWLYDEQGKLKPQVWLTLNGERIYEDEFAKSLKDGDELSIMLAILGG